MSAFSQCDLIFSEADANVTLQAISDFTNLYLATFNDKNEREDPAEWIHRITRKPNSPQPVTHILLVRTAAGTLAGGIVFEYYRSSCCGLITYLVVSSDFRRQGIGRQLMDRATAILERDAATANHNLRAVFAESEDPARFVSTFGPMPPRERIRAFARLGARWLHFPYVQPALGTDNQRVQHLLLLTFPVHDELGDYMDGSLVVAFLDEFFRALGISVPGNDSDFKDMRAFLVRPVVLNDLSHFKLVPHAMEVPALSLPSCSVCLHLLEKVPALNNPVDPLDYQYCPVLSSMELDLLAHAFRNPAACNSECVTSGHRQIEIVVPPAYIYQTEGHVIEQTCANTVIKAQLGISRTTFARSGRVVWHMALIPAAGSAFTEYDIIKLIHLYDGKSEQTGLSRLIGFKLAGEEASMPLDALLVRLTGCGSVAVMAGTVQILNGVESEDECEDVKLLRMVRLSRQDGGDEYHDQLLALMRKEGRESRILKAYCGIVTGIFDFAEIDSEEALDTLEPTFADKHSYIRLQRSTLVSISAEDRALEALYDRVGASPYLFLPHAVLIHNESVVVDAEREIDRALRALIRSKPGIKGLFRRKAYGSLVDLERSRHSAESNLGHFLPNIFNYVTEREMLQRGADGRGLMERRAATQTRLQDLTSNIDSIWHIRREIGQMLIALLLMLMSVLQVKGSFEQELQNLSTFGLILLFVVTTMACGGVILWLWLRGLRKSPAKNES